MRFDTRMPRRCAIRGPIPALLLLLALIAVPAQAEWLQGEQAIMGTRCVVELWSTDRARGQAAIDAVFTEFRRIDALMSTYKPESELSRVNATAATAPVRVSRELYDLLATSIEYSKLTGGAFDVTYASVGYLYDYRARVHPDAEAIAAALPGIDYRHIELDPETHSVRFRQPGVRIDLGGIAKGHAVDRGIAVLQALGIDRAMVNAGGDTRIIGDRLGARGSSASGTRTTRTRWCFVSRSPTRRCRPPGTTNGTSRRTASGITTSWIPRPVGRRTSCDR